MSPGGGQRAPQLPVPITLTPRLALELRWEVDPIRRLASEQGFTLLIPDFQAAERWRRECQRSGIRPRDRLVFCSIHQSQPRRSLVALRSLRSLPSIGMETPFRSAPGGLCGAGLFDVNPVQAFRFAHNV
jgi:hypothetical protein